MDHKGQMGKRWWHKYEVVPVTKQKRTTKSHQISYPFIPLKPKKKGRGPNNSIPQFYFFFLKAKRGSIFLHCMDCGLGKKMWVRVKIIKKMNEMIKE